MEGNPFASAAVAPDRKVARISMNTVTPLTSALDQRVRQAMAAALLLIVWAALTLASGAFLGQGSVRADTRSTYALDSGLAYAIQTNDSAAKGAGCTNTGGNFPLPSRSYQSWRLAPWRHWIAVSARNTIVWSRKPMVPPTSDCDETPNDSLS